MYRHDAYTNYHALQALLSRQRGNFNFTASYTFSKSLGIRTSEVGNSWGSEYIVPVKGFYYGISGQDRTHVASVSFSWLLKEFKDNAALNAFLGGWQVAGVASYVSGAPLQLANGTNFNIQGTNAHGVTIDGVHIAGSPQMTAFPVLTCDPTQNVPSGYMVNPSCFAAPSVGQNGNYIMPYMKGNAYKNLDMSLFKNFSIGSKGQKIQLRISGYNVLNHPTWYPDTGPEPDAELHERRPDERQLREDQRGQQVRTAHRAGRAALHLLGSSTEDRRPAGVASGGARRFFPPRRAARRLGRILPAGAGHIIVEDVPVTIRPALLIAFVLSVSLRAARPSGAVRRLRARRPPLQ